MKLSLYCLKDVVIGEYMNPVLYHNDEEAIRAVRIGVSSPNFNDPNIGDKQLWRIGDYDSSTGALCSRIDMLANVIDLKEVKKDVREESCEREEESK